MTFFWREMRRLGVCLAKVTVRDTKQVSKRQIEFQTFLKAKRYGRPGHRENHHKITLINMEVAEWKLLFDVFKAQLSTVVVRNINETNCNVRKGFVTTLHFPYISKYLRKISIHCAKLGTFMH